MILKASLEHVDDLYALQSCVLDSSEYLLSREEWRICVQENDVFLSIEDDTAVGALIAKKDNSGDMKLDHVFTHPEYRRQGIARALIDQFVELQEQRSQTAFLQVSPENYGAVSLYEQIGFRASKDVIAKYLSPSARALYEATGITQNHRLIMVREPETALA